MDDEAAIGAAIDGMYAMISGPAGPRDWSRQPDWFHPDCRQVRTGVDAQGRPWRQAFTLAEYSADADVLLAERDFFETELSRELRVFGNVAHAWSRYEARTSSHALTPERRGINSIQLLREADGRWRIVHMTWDNERPGLSLPD